MMNRAILAGALSIVLGLCAGIAQADNERGFYAGAGIGQFNLKIDDIIEAGEELESLDDDDTAWKAFVGWRFAPFIAVEAAYIDFGSPGDSFEAAGSSGDFSADIAGFAPYLIGTLPLGPLELFAKVGYYFYDVDASVDFDIDELDFDSSSSEEDLLYGAGIGITLFEHLNARLEYEEIDSDVLDDANALWLSGAWRF